MTLDSHNPCYVNPTGPGASDGRLQPKPNIISERIWLLRPPRSGGRVLFHLSKQRLVVGQPGVAFSYLESPI